MDGFLPFLAIQYCGDKNNDTATTGKKNKTRKFS